jgi:GNAT superfamily N-acetyltransferase
MLPIEIRRVTSKRERAVFIKMAWQFYKKDPLWVPPLISDQAAFLDPVKGVFFDHGEAELFLAYRGASPVGRISAHVNRRHDDYFGAGKGFVGFFECENDAETAHALFNAAANWLRSRGKTVAEGPMSFSVYDELGILIDGFDSPPYLLTVFNPPYYKGLFEACEWEKAVDWFAYRGRKGFIDKNLDPVFSRLSRRVLKRNGMTIRRMDLKNALEREAGIVKEIFKDAWNENWGHVPLSDKEFDRFKESLARIVVPELSLIVEVDGRPVAFTLSAYDANIAVKKVNGRLFPIGFLILLLGIKKTDRFRLILMGVLEKYRKQGIEVAMYARIIEEGLRLGFREAEMSLIVENNERMLSSIRHLPVEKYKTWRVFRKDLIE